MIALLVVLMLMTILAVTLCGANTYQPGHKFRPEHAQHPPTSFRLEYLRSASVAEVRY